MKKTIATLLSLTLLLLGLCACDWEEWFKTTDPTETTTTAAAIDIPGALMPPLQGGPMLYTFYGTEPYRTVVSEMDGEEYPEYPLGLVDQNGQLAADPIYHRVDYIYDAQGERVIGLAAMQDRSLAIWQLSGENRTLPCEGYRIDVYPGGRYATVMAAASGGLFGDSSEDPIKDGIYDLEKDRWAIEPKDGQMIQYSAGGMVLVHQYDSAYAMKEIAQWAFDCATETRRDLPLSLGRVQNYYPETGWYGAIWTQGEYEARYYDKDLNRVEFPAGWAIEGGFMGGQYCKVWRLAGSDREERWLDRSAKFAALTADAIRGYGSCYLAGDEYLWQTKQGVYYDTDLNPLLKTGPGERFATLEREGSVAEPGVLLLGADGGVKDARTGKGKAFAKTADFRYWKSYVTGSEGEDYETIYALQNGVWRALNLERFLPRAKAEDRESVPYVRALAISENSVVITVGVHWYAGAITYNTLAVDWDGEPLDDCPLIPFYDLITGFNAGEQGPSYFWIVEDGRRGYINVKGEWVFEA